MTLVTDEVDRYLQLSLPPSAETRRDCQMRILVIDDDPAIRDSLRMSLSYEGYDVVGAATGREGLAFVERQVPISDRWTLRCLAWAASVSSTG